LVLEPSEEVPELDPQQPRRALENTELVQLPKHKAAVFDQFARAQLLRGTGLPEAPTFAQTSQSGHLLDLTGFKRFCAQYGIDGVLDNQQICDIFVQFCGADGNKGHMDLRGFTRCASMIQKECQKQQAQWAVVKPHIPLASGGSTQARAGGHTPQCRDVTLTVKQMQKKPCAKRPTPLSEQQSLRMVEPVKWKKELRELTDEAERHAKESVRLSAKAAEHVAENQQRDVLARDLMISALNERIHKTQDQISTLERSITEVTGKMHVDADELIKIEEREAIVHNFLDTAIKRLERRVDRPIQEQQQDLAFYSLRDEISQARGELVKLKADHKRLHHNIQDLHKDSLKLEKDIKPKRIAIDLDAQCVSRLSILKVKTAEE